MHDATQPTWKQLLSAIAYKPYQQPVAWLSFIHATLISLVGTCTLIHYSAFYYTHITHVLHHGQPSDKLVTDVSSTYILPISVWMFLVTSAYYIIDLIYITICTPHNTVYISYAVHHIVTAIGLSSAAYQYVMHGIYDIVWIMPVLALVEYSNPPRSIADICTRYQTDMRKQQPRQATQTTNATNTTQLRQRKTNGTTSQPTVEPSSRDDLDDTIVMFTNIHLFLFIIVRFIITQYTVRVYWHVYISQLSLCVAWLLILFSIGAVAAYVSSVDGGIHGCFYVGHGKHKLDLMV